MKARICCCVLNFESRMVRRRRTCYPHDRLRIDHMIWCTWNRKVYNLICRCSRRCCWCWFEKSYWRREEEGRWEGGRKWANRGLLMIIGWKQRCQVRGIRSFGRRDIVKGRVDCVGLGKGKGKLEERKEKNRELSASGEDLKILPLAKRDWRRLGKMRERRDI